MRELPVEQSPLTVAEYCQQTGHPESVLRECIDENEQLVCRRRPTKEEFLLKFKSEGNQ